MILEKIKKPNDIHKIPLEDFEPLAAEIRDFLIRSVSQTGGHLASNLGVVELTLALHNVLDFPEDKLIWDVGHQAYTHKILTGRKDEFKNLRQEGGLSGFPKRSESPCDAYDAGHSSNSISAGLGYVHSMAHQLGGFYNLPHGVCNAILLPHVEKFNSANTGDKLRKVAEILGENVEGLSVEEANAKAIEAIMKLSERVGIPKGLKELGVKEEDFKVMAENALKDVCAGTNPREVTLEDTIALYKVAL